MKRKIAAVLCCLAMTMTLLAGCGSGGDSGTNSAKETEQKSDETEQKSEETSAKADASAKDEVTIGFSNDADSWDPCTGFGYTGSPLYSSLVRVNGDDKLENDLATEYSVSEDALTWTFKIRNDVVFSDKEPLKASDVAFTFNTTKEKATYMDLTMLESCTAADDTTVEFKLNKPCVTFIYTVAQIGIVPEKSYSD